MTSDLLITPKRFFENWHNTTLNERQSYQAHFIEVCQMLGHAHPTGTGKDPRGNIFKFEESGDGGFADVYFEGHFAIEYKAPEKYKDLKAAYTQLQGYREQLKNPPLLVVTDIAHWEIHTNFENSAPKVYKFSHSDLAPDSSNYSTVRGYLDAMFEAPRRLHPDYTTVALTLDAAKGFQRIADSRRKWSADPIRVARFLTKIVFCLFADDIHLLPLAQHSVRGIFGEIIHDSRGQPEIFREDTARLFRAMAEGKREFRVKIPYVNGSLFKNVDVEDLQTDELEILDEVSQLDWSQIEPAIFGTLFEGALDKDKRAQLGAHYTSREDILLIIEPILMIPLRREWAAIKAQALPMYAEYQKLVEELASDKAFNDLKQKREGLRKEILQRVRTTTVLDPACGSGNFLYVSLQRLMSLEKEIIMDEVWEGLGIPTFEVHPLQMYGIETDPIAHALASIVVWIGYIQWRSLNISSDFDEPILRDLNTNNILHADAIMRFDEHGKPVEPEWPPTTVIVGNPPFLGDKKMKRKLDAVYVNHLRKLYAGRVPGAADLVTYWFEKARTQLEAGKVQCIGLLATNSIRQGVNQDVLKRIKQKGDIFMAWSDREWMLEGAAVRVSIVGFDKRREIEKSLDGRPVAAINADLTSGVDLTQISPLEENTGIAFLGMMKGGPFEIDENQARTMLESTNSSGNSNTDVVKRRFNGEDTTKGWKQGWIIDFASMTERQASAYELPFQHVEKNVKPGRLKNSDATMKQYWWLHGRSRPALREKLVGLSRFIATPEVSKHRIFVWLDQDIIPDHKLHVFTRQDDYFFGVLHSKIHEIWSIRVGSWMGKGNDPVYASSRIFLTFRFPYLIGQEPIDDPCYQAIAQAAKQLHEERQEWLEGVTSHAPAHPERRYGKGKQEKGRTLTNLYNALMKERGVDPKAKLVVAAKEFAPRLNELHQALDRAVCAAYGWDVPILDDDDEILSHLLTLNLARVASQN